MTWLKPIRLLPLALPLLLSGCQSSLDLGAVTGKPVAPVPQAQIDPALAQAPAPPSGLTPLPSPQQVVSAQPVGRPDPFLPVQGVAVSGGSAGQPALPPGFRFNGVIHTGGQAQALVQFGSESGSVAAGYVGGPNKLLPAGWAVGAIDVARGRLILRVSGQAIPVSLDRQS